MDAGGEGGSCPASVCHELRSRALQVDRAPCSHCGGGVMGGRVGQFDNLREKDVLNIYKSGTKITRILLAIGLYT